MARPNELPKFADEDVSDATSGQNNVGTPTPNQKKWGWYGSKVKPSRQVMNWLHRLYYRWITWFDLEQQRMHTLLETHKSDIISINNVNSQQSTLINRLDNEKLNNATVTTGVTTFTLRSYFGSGASPTVKESDVECTWVMNNGIFVLHVPPVTVAALGTRTTMFHNIDLVRTAGARIPTTVITYDSSIGIIIFDPVADNSEKAVNVILDRRSATAQEFSLKWVSDGNIGYPLNFAESSRHILPGNTFTFLTTN